MTNASRASARAGWDEYRSETPAPSLDTINRRLAFKGFDAVSRRTYIHYEKLAKHGYDEYMPVNDLDTLLKLDKRKAS
jgi:hypothetical protein